ncbi:CobW family GTP-binding protein [Peribacillus sp. SCS-37]|uniref:CobW family GTP-binding protein n=1 Tax=Paraperibacillus esterisolvens TaxID=3115296 RepID=UPI003906B32D
MGNTEIYILGGFLGSGKTTLLGHVIKEERKSGRKIAVLMNELGKISLDSYFIEEGIPLKELYDGCICCTLQDKLEVQIHELLQEEELDAIYIETTGAAHPVEVLDGIMSPLFADKLIYKGIITVVDLLRWRDLESFSPQIRQLIIEQVHHADLIILNKIDLVSEAEAAGQVYKIQALNKGGRILMTEHARIPIEQIYSLRLTGKKEHKAADVVKQLKLQAVLHEFKGEIEQSLFEDWIRSLPETVYRMKGFIKLSSSSKPVLFQYSYGTPLYMPQEMNMPLKLVIIGENIEADEIKESLLQIESEK